MDFNQILDIFKNSGQILLLLLFFYGVLRALRNTPGMYAFSSLMGIFAVLSLLSSLTGQTVVGRLCRFLIDQLPFVVIVVFQLEIRRALQFLAKFFDTPRRTVFGQISADRKIRSTQPIINEIVRAVCCLSARPEWREALRDENGHLSVDPTRRPSQHTGALIAIQGQQGLDEYVERAVPLDCAINNLLLQSIFFSGGPLHDGGVIIRKNRIIAAGRNFPPASETALGPAHTRHNAAIGLSERTDALVIVVSEESGHVSVVSSGHELEVLNTPQGLTKALRTHYDLDSLEKDMPLKRWAKRVLNWFRPKS